MKNIYGFLLLGFLSLLFLTPALMADDREAVRFELIVRQQPEMVDRYFEITRDTVDVVSDKSISAFLVNMMLDIDMEAVDSQSVTFNIHLVTVGSNPYNAAKRFRIEYNLPARMENIPGKNGSLYQLLISPREIVNVDSPPCEFEPYGGKFKMDPSANFDLYYVDGALADFHWNNIKNYLEADHTRFRKALGINTPGKISFYLSPCASGTVAWDKRFGYGIDPGRSTVHTIYNHDFTSVDVILPNMLILYRLYGYAPPFMVEGLAGYFDYVAYRVKKLDKESGLLSIKELLTTSGYKKADPVAAEICASSFTKYLTDNYGIGKYMDWYERADDLTIPAALEEVFGKPLDSLEAGWKQFVDTVQLERRLFDHYASRANALYQTDLQIEYMKKMAEYDMTRADSVDSWKKLSVVYYQYGHYYDAVDGYRRLIAIDSSLPLYWQVLGNLDMINGEYDKAWGCFDTVLSLDTTYATAGLLQAKITAIRGDTAKAIEMAEKFYATEQNISGKIEFMLFLGEMYGTPGGNYDSATADGYYTDALVWSQEMIPKVQNDPIYNLRAGLAYLGLGQYDEAIQFLGLVEFTEMRAYYQGLIKMSLGKAHDLMGDRETAVDYYRAALSVPLAAFHRDLCEKYIQEPFRK